MTTVIRKTFTNKDMLKDHKLKILGYSLAFSFTCTPLAWAFNGIATDGSMGPAQVLSAPGVATNVNIPQSLGTTVGNNLFHSFSTFNVETGQTVTFQENITNSLTNVISRVTGGSVSNLDGMLRSTPGGHADFYFINPAGVVFGANATLDVAGAVHISTADQLNFQDGGHYNATNPNASSLSSSAPTSFGFLGTSPANNGLIEFNGTQLATKDGQTLDVVAGQIKIENLANISISQGEIRMVAMQGQGQVDLQPTPYGNLPLPDSSLLNTNGGNIEIKDSYVQKTSSESGQGRGALWGGNFSVVNSLIGAYTDSNIDELPGQGIVIQSTTLAINNSVIETVGYGSGKAGDLALSSTGNMDIINGSVVHTRTSGAGDAGDLTLQAGQLNIGAQGTADLNQIESLPQGDSATGKPGKINIETQTALNLYGGSDISTMGANGDITIKVGSLKLDSLDNPDNLTQISTIMPSGGVGTGGSINVESRGAIEVFHNASISSETDGFGNAGNLNIKSQSLKLDGLQCSVCPTIGSFANIGSSGNAGSVMIDTLGAVELYNGSLLTSSTGGSGNGGTLSIKADNLKIVGSGNTIPTQITTDTQYGTGKAGDLWIETRGALEILNTAEISSGTSTLGSSGNVSVKAGSIKLDGQGSGFHPGIYSYPTSSMGYTGSVTVESTGNVELIDGGSIAIRTLGVGNAGDITVKADNIIMDGKGSSAGSRISSDTYAEAQGNAGSVNIQATHAINMTNGAIITSDNFGQGDSGNVIIQSITLNIDGLGNTSFPTGIFAQSYLGSTGRAGTVSVQTTGNLSIYNNGEISSSTFGSGDAGQISVNAKSMTIDPQQSILQTGIFSVAEQGGQGQGGTIRVTVNGPINIQGVGLITSDTFGPGKAGSVSVKADSLTINGLGTPYSSGIVSDTKPGSTGQAGSVDVTANRIDLSNAGRISTNTSGLGSAGSVQVTSQQISIDNGSIAAKADANSGGQTGNVEVNASGSINITSGGNISIQNDGSTQNPAGITPSNLTVQTPQLSLDNGIITAKTSGNVNAGLVTVKVTQTLGLDNYSKITAETSGLGGAGNVDVSSTTLSETNSSSINSSTSGSGNAGSVKVNAPSINLDNSAITAETSGLGAAGSVNVSSATLSIMNSASIAAKADIGSGGQTGNVEVNASGSITLGNSNISIQNLGFALNPKAITPGLLYVSAPHITLRGSSITSQSTQNVGASPIQIHFTHSLSLDPSFISTEAQNGNGGSITIQGGDILTLANSGIRTSVLGQNGNGGDISVTANRLTMETGLIQANTAATGANGGNVFLNVGTLLPSGSMLIFGGNEPVNWDIHATEFGWNVIQAAAPGGISGVINLTSPQLNLNGVLSNLGNPNFYSDTLNQDVCSVGAGSTLVRSGKGGMPAKSSDTVLFY